MIETKEPDQHQEFKPLRAAIHKRNQTKQERQQMSAGLSRGIMSGQTVQATDQRGTLRHRYPPQLVKFELVDPPGIEPGTCRLRVECSAS